MPIKEDVIKLTNESLQTIGYMMQLINLHEDGIPIKLSGPTEQLNVDFGVTPVSSANKVILRANFRTSAQLVKDKMDELLTIVPE